MHRLALKKRNQKIIKLFAEGIPAVVLAKRFKLSRRMIYYVIERQDRYLDHPSS